MVAFVSCRSTERAGQRADADGSAGPAGRASEPVTGQGRCLRCIGRAGWRQTQERLNY